MKIRYIHYDRDAFAHVALEMEPHGLDILVSEPEPKDKEKVGKSLFIKTEDGQDFEYSDIMLVLNIYKNSCAPEADSCFGIQNKGKLCINFYRDNHWELIPHIYDTERGIYIDE
jgi:hypothetical protein